MTGRAPAWRRLLYATLAVAGGTALGVLVLLAPALYGAIPFEVMYTVKRTEFELAALAVVFALVVTGRAPGAARWVGRGAGRAAGWAWALVVSYPPAARLAGRAGSALASVPAGRVDDACRWALGWPATAAYAAGCAYLLLAWAPHYLTWPWWPDTDQFAVSALMWDAGVLPFKELEDFDFPGPIYAHYVLGRLFGWGKTVPFNASDAATVVALGAAMAAWGRRVLGGALPGLAGYAMFLGVYLSLPYSLVAQRDWHAPCFALMGVMALEALPGRRGRLLSALGFALAMTYRPQPVVFLPALLSAVAEGVARPRESFARAARPFLEWAAAAAVFGALLAAPMVVNGVFDDFLHGLRRVRAGGSYNRETWGTFDRILRDELTDRFNTRLMFATLTLAAAGPAGLRGPARTWLLALAGVLFYKPISPVAQDYLGQPLELTRSVAVAVPVAWLLATPRLGPRARLAAAAAALYLVMPYHPRYCSLAKSREALGPLRRGEDPVVLPIGAAGSFDRIDFRYDIYRWDDYRRALAYLRGPSATGVPVANLLRDHPFPSINGPAGRPTVFPAAGGFIHLWMVDLGLLPRFAERLEGARGALAVWSPRTHSLKPLRYPELEAVLRRCYRREAAFGKIEVWRNVGEAAAAAAPPQSPPGGEPVGGGRVPPAVPETAGPPGQ